MLAGEEAAFDRFADEYYPGLYRFAARRLHDRELTREIVQTTACKAIAKLASYRGDAPLFTWLCAICRTEIALHFRTRSRRPSTVELTEAGGLPVSAREAPEKAVFQRETEGLVHETLDGLPSRYGQALEWKYIEGVAVAEIARRLELSPKAAESLLTRARQAFREGYQRLTRRIPSRPFRLLDGEETMGSAP
jgi:RNA polymerase sigma-70 factor (ECF subfamily)